MTALTRVISYFLVHPHLSLLLTLQFPHLIERTFVFTSALLRSADETLHYINLYYRKVVVRVG